MDVFFGNSFINEYFPANHGYDYQRGPKKPVPSLEKSSVLEYQRHDIRTLRTRPKGHGKHTVDRFMDGLTVLPSPGNHG